MRLAILFLTLLALAPSQAQESPTPTPAITPSPSTTPPPPPPTRNVPLRFALPPLKGTISLGIYDRSGKLVRVLHREDAVADFTAGNDALETVWDGNDDDGNSLPTGKYSARGYVVGDLKVEGIDYFFNDWVTDEKSPHILRVTQLWKDNGELRVDAELAGGRKTAFVFDPKTGALLNEVSPDRRSALQGSSGARECGRRDRLRDGQKRNDLVGGCSPRRRSASGQTTAARSRSFAPPRICRG